MSFTSFRRPGHDALRRVAAASTLLALTVPVPAQAQSITPRAAPGVLSNHVVHCDGRPRAVQLYLPSNYATLPPMPVVFAFHGGGLNSQSMSNGNAGIGDAAERHGFIAVYPNGVPTSPAEPDKLNWRDDEVVFIDCLMGIVRGALRTNPRRYYAVGFSAGGKVAYQLAADPVTAAKIAAIATSSSVAGKKPTSPPSSAWAIVDPTLATVSQVRGAAARVPSNVSAMLLQGALDPKHSVGGGYSPASNDINFSFQMTVDLFRLSVQADVEHQLAIPGVPARCEVKEYSSTANRYKVVSILDPDMGHEWPTKQNWPYMEVIWAFFGLVPTR